MPNSSRWTSGRQGRASTAALHNLELRGHPWTGSPFNRTDWMKGLDVPLMAENPDVDILFWVGCSGAIVERNQTSTIALAKLLQAAGVKFGVLGDEDLCTGDAARRLGAEHYFQERTEEALSTGSGVIVTSCPFCMQVFDDGLKSAGAEGRAKVVDISELIAKTL